MILLALETILQFVMLDIFGNMLYYSWKCFEGVLVPIVASIGLLGHCLQKAKKKCKKSKEEPSPFKKTLNEKPASTPLKPILMSPLNTQGTIQEKLTLNTSVVSLDDSKDLGYIS